jgi:DNA invertase Pin-like site-specific DNA recombinase
VDGKFVSYIRVSTQKQGKSGLGLAAQQEAVREYLNGGRHKVGGEFVEVESGKRSDNRPQLQKALQLCRAHKAQLLVAKLDRLARNVAFISTLMEADVKFVAIDLPEANNLTVHVMAAMAEHEARAISERTKVALAAAKKRGVSLGGRRMSREHWDEHAAKGRAEGRLERSRAASKWAADVMPVIESLREEGAFTLREIAAGLNERGIEARRGGKWNSVQVMRVLKTAQEGGS